MNALSVSFQMTPICVCAVHTPEGQGAIQKHLYRFKQWVQMKLVWLSKAKCKVWTWIVATLAMSTSWGM